MGRIFLITGIGLAALYLAVCALAYVGQRRLFFPAPGVRVPVAGRGKVVEVPGGTVLLWRPVEGPEGVDAGPVVVHFHGNAEQIANVGWLAEAYAARGFSFAAIEYPGYPGAAGEPTEEGILRAAEQGLEYLTRELGVARERLVLSGQSLGTGVAVAMAARGWGTRLVLVSPYTSLADVAAHVAPWLPARLLVRERFEAAGWAGQVSVPVLILHGARDQLIPVELGRELATRFASVRLLELPEAGHNDVWDAPEALQEVLAFVEVGRR